MEGFKPLKVLGGGGASPAPPTEAEMPMPGGEGLNPPPQLPPRRQVLETS